MTPATEDTKPASDNETLPSARMSPLFRRCASKSPGCEEFSSIREVVRIFSHISYAVKENDDLWPFVTTAPYTGLIQSSELFSYLIGRYHAHDINWPFESIINFFHTYMSPKLEFILELASLISTEEDTDRESTRRFDENFRLGSHGLNPIINWFRRIDTLLAAKLQILSSGDCELLVTLLEPYAQALHSLMAHLHCNYDRVYYDIRELAQLCLDLQEHVAIFEVLSFILC
ncbi:hypothetical protein K439DRAFT_418581 [Ramaria rubella]|nr:hypothetical protein K439DRAFT_418581 [Ramaria rubella]